MRRIAAILFSALLLITQSLAALVPVHLPEIRTCCGCDCTQRACCNTVPRPAGQPTQPLAAQRETASAQKLARVSLKAQAPSPVGIVREFSSLKSASPQPPVPPFYRLHCALLL